jgi:hypothetical protein
MAALSLAWIACAAQADPLVPDRDDQVIESLPATVVARNAVQSARRSPQAAVAQAREWLAQARRSGDPRPAGQAIAALEPWAARPQVSAEVVLMLATAEQFLHEFEPAAQRLQTLLARDAAQPQAWLTLATLRRVQGRYADSDRACRQLLRLRAELYGRACLAENAALRGEADAARAELSRLLAQRLDTATQGWLLTTLAELEERSGRAVAAETAYRAALAADAEGYTRLAYADFLIAAGRRAEAREQLRSEPRSDAVLLRLALASTEAPAGQAAAAELRERFAQADQRPGAAAAHARERALFALHVDHNPAAALALARTNLTLQREPLDLLVFAQAARAVGQSMAIAEARRITEETGLHDHRIDLLF